ncbi:MAG: hypothetical protein ABIQ41_08060 [Gemmatimonadales bacterium]
MAEDLGGGKYNLRADYLCCANGDKENACVHVPAGRLFDTESPAHLAVGMLMKKFAPKLGRKVEHKKVGVDKTISELFEDKPRAKAIGKKKKWIIGLV